MYYLISPIVLIIYLLFIHIKYGKVSSISESYTKLSDVEKPLFSLAWILYIAPIVLIEPSRWFIGAMLFLSLVPSNPDYWTKRGFQDELHVIGAYGTILLGCAGLIAKSPIIGSFVVGIYAILAIGIEINFRILVKVKNETYWQEVMAAILIPLTLTFLK